MAVLKSETNGQNRDPVVVQLSGDPAMKYLLKASSWTILTTFSFFVESYMVFESCFILWSEK